MSGVHVLAIWAVASVIAGLVHAVAATVQGARERARSRRMDRELAELIAQAQRRPPT